MKSGWIGWVGFLMALGCAVDPGEPRARPEVPFFFFPTQREIGDSGDISRALLDIERHLPLTEPLFPEMGGPVLGPSIKGHEETHGIAGHLLKEHANLAGVDRAYGFYLLEDRAVVFEEPAIRKSDVNGFVPEALRGNRFAVYLEEQEQFDDHPLYLIDEWVAYLNQGAITLERYERGFIPEKRGLTYGVVDGALEFSIYGIALLRAIEALDPDYLESQPSFPVFVDWLLQRSLELFRRGDRVPMFQLSSQRELLAGFLGEAGEPLRRAL